MKDYYIFQHCKLDADEHVLRIEGDKKRRLPVEEIAGLHLLAGYSMTSGVIELVVPVRSQSRRDAKREAERFSTAYEPPLFPNNLNPNLPLPGLHIHLHENNLLPGSQQHPACPEGHCNSRAHHGRPNM